MFIKVIYGKYAFFFFFFHNGAPSTKFVNYIAVLSFCQYNGLGGEPPVPLRAFQVRAVVFPFPFDPISFPRAAKGDFPFGTPDFFQILLFNANFAYNNYEKGENLFFLS